MTPSSPDRIIECIPAALCGSTTTVTALAGGLSGAGVYRVESNDRIFVLKISDDHEPLDAWRARLEILRLASDAGVAPLVVHADEERRAVLSAFVSGKPFVAAYWDPRTRDVALGDLGRMLRRVHDLPLPDGVATRGPREYLAATWSELSALPVAAGLPAFVGEAVRRVLDETPPPSERRAVLSHNDVNPGNLMYDEERLLLVDWDAAGRNDPYYDLATIALFNRMDDQACRLLLAAHDGEPVAELPAYFGYARRLIAVLSAVAGMRAQTQRFNGEIAAPTGEIETLDSALSLSEFYQKLRAGEVLLNSPEGGRAFALALVKESVAL